jgi:hypothetical protein
MINTLGYFANMKKKNLICVKFTLGETITVTWHLNQITSYQYRTFILYICELIKFKSLIDACISGSS